MPAPSPLEAPQATPVTDVLAHFGVSAGHGLSEAEVERRRDAFGANIIAARRKARALLLLLHQFNSPVIYLLGIAAGLAFYFKELEEGIAILAVLLINATIGFVTELKAARSIEALRALGTRSARVRRDRHVRLIPAQDIVPGDIVLLEAGDSISADIRLVEASNLAADESALTGESVAVEKHAHAVSATAVLAERHSMLFKGTSLTRGSGIGVVVATGLATELGHISQLVEEAQPGSSPLEKKLTHLSGQLVIVTLILTAAIAGVGLSTGKDAFLMVEAAIALAVAAIPEGLPIVATLALARGMWRMARKNALIERLSAIETLGATTVILTDKTGTLTENRMAVRRLFVPGGEVVLTGDEQKDKGALKGDSQLTALLEAAVLCNDASLDEAHEDGSGDPMELALLRVGLHAGLSQARLAQKEPLANKHAFDTDTKMMATIHRHGDRYLFAVKGAPEAVLGGADHVTSVEGDEPLTPKLRREWHERVSELAHHGLRVLACATKSAAKSDEAPYQHLTLLGLIGLEDPARADVPGAIEHCRKAGIRVVMVTGDHAATARSIGRAVGLGQAATVLEGDHIKELADDAPAKLFDVDIFARVSPAEKLALVRTYQGAGEVVAMTGDGVNDAPALRQADIGIAMGRRGTDVAREAAAMILLDDAFPSIVEAIREGRVIFDNIHRFVAYLLSCNLSEVLVVGLAVLSTLPLPVLPLQILYLNLITDVFPAFALAMGEGEPGILARKPRNPREPILGRRQWTIIVLQSLALTAGTFGALAAAELGLSLDNRKVVTVTFLTLAFAQLWHVFDMRDPHSSPIRNEVTRNPWVWAALALCTTLLVIPPYWPPLADLLNLAPPSLPMWAVILGLSLAPVIASQLLMTTAGAFARKRS